MTERQHLVRDIHYVGYYSPEVIAEYLIQQGWTKRRPKEKPQIHIEMVGEPAHVTAERMASRWTP